MATTLDHSDAEQLEQLKAIVAEQQQRLEALEGQQLQPTEAETKQRRSTRRELLKLAGATIAGAAGSAALRAVPAAAADGDTMLSGTVRTETLGNPTGITQFGVGYGIALEGLTGYGGWGVRGYAYGSSGKAIRGYAYGGIGVYGEGFSTYGGSGAFLAGTTWGSLNEGGYGGAFATGTTYGVKASGSTAVAASGGNAGVSATSSTTGSTAVYGFSAATASAGVIGRVIGSGLTVHQLHRARRQAFRHRPAGQRRQHHRWRLWGAHIHSHLRLPRDGQGQGRVDVAQPERRVRSGRLEEGQRRSR
ncbi:MAG: hypothetical protein E6I69_10135 [Chloroflexi bacterium]|nr:MAG: hypothetical protein E6I69_10135 [Chloroflexota bacterium]